MSANESKILTEKIQPNDVMKKFKNIVEVLDQFNPETPIDELVSPEPETTITSNPLLEGLELNPENQRSLHIFFSGLAFEPGPLYYLPKVVKEPGSDETYELTAVNIENTIDHAKKPEWIHDDIYQAMLNCLIYFKNKIREGISPDKPLPNRRKELLLIILTLLNSDIAYHETENHRNVKMTKFIQSVNTIIGFFEPSCGLSSGITLNKRISATWLNGQLKENREILRNKLKRATKESLMEIDPEIIRIVDMFTLIFIPYFCIPLGLQALLIIKKLIEALP